MHIGRPRKGKKHTIYNIFRSRQKKTANHQREQERELAQSKPKQTSKDEREREERVRARGRRAELKHEA